MRHVVTVALLIAGIIHLLPLSGALGPERLAVLYGTLFSDPNMIILLRHRAVLFGLIGTFLVAAAFLPRLQVGAFIAGLISVVSFLLLAWSVEQYNSSIARIVTVDLMALGVLVVGLGAHLLQTFRSK